MKTLKLEFGTEGERTLDTGVPVLRGESRKRLLDAGRFRDSEGMFSLLETENWLVGWVSVEGEQDLERTGCDLYSEMLTAAGGWNLARIWNYVPEINEIGPTGLENYRAFSHGRSTAFENGLRECYPQQVPAASAVGTSDHKLTIVFAATRFPVEFVENPLQVPAYNYPVDYGPRSPSFARGSVVKESPVGTIFISGTAAVRGHQTVAPRDTMGQLECTLENLKEISIVSGMRADLTLGLESGRASRHFNVYVREAHDCEMIADVLDRRLLGPDDAVSFLHSDICRTQLMVEIEVTVTSSTLLGNARRC